MSKNILKLQICMFTTFFLAGAAPQTLPLMLVPFCTATVPHGQYHPPP